MYMYIYVYIYIYIYMYMCVCVYPTVAAPDTATSKVGPRHTRPISSYICTYVYV